MIVLYIIGSIVVASLIASFVELMIKRSRRSRSRFDRRRMAS
jgi:hypothetical protein